MTVGDTTQKIPSWIRLDNTAHLWPAIQNARYTSIFRLQVQVDQIVKVDLLQTALEDVLPGFPFFQVAVRTGLFWYVLERRKDFPKVEADVVNPCMNPKVLGKTRWPFRVRVYGRHIGFEFSHLLTDGAGALEFARALCDRYLTLFDLGGNRETLVFTEPGPEHWEDWAMDMAKARAPLPAPLKEAFHHPFRLAKPGYHHVLHALLPVLAMLQLAKSLGLTLTEYIVAITLQVLQDEAIDLHAQKKIPSLRPIRIMVPINLRTVFNTPSGRNFFAFAHPEIDPRLGYHSFEEICATVKYTIRRQMQQGYLLQQISRNVNNGRSLFIRMTPLLIKNLMISAVYARRGDGLFTMSISNLGKVESPSEHFRNHVKSWQFIAPPNPVGKINMNMISFDDTLAITFSSVIKNETMQSRFLRTLVAKKIPIRLVSNKELMESLK